MLSPLIKDSDSLSKEIRTMLFRKIEKYCTNYGEIRDMLNYEQPIKYLVTSTEYSKNNLIPVLTANKIFLLGYTDEKTGIYKKGDCILFDDFTMDVKFVTFPFKIKSSAIKILTPKFNIDLYFMYQYLLYLNLISEEHKRHYISEIEPMIVVHPTLKIQRQISEKLYAIEKKIANSYSLMNLWSKHKEFLLSHLFI